MLEILTKPSHSDPSLEDPPKMATGAHGKQRSKARAVLLGALRPQKKAEVSPFKASKGLSLYPKGNFHVASGE